MPIEFRCHRCQRLLRTADDTGGKQTRCPECGTILDIPVPAAMATDPGLQAANPFAATPGNPYAAPTAPPGAAATPAAVVRGFTPTPIDVGDILNRTWNIFSKNLADMIIGGLIIFGVTLAIVIPVMILMIAGMGIGGAIANQGQGNEPVGAIVIIFTVLLAIVVAMLGSFWLYSGMACWFLKVARGEPRSYLDLFRGGPYLPRVMGAGLVFAVAMSLGYMLCIVPGVIVGLMFSQFLMLIVDRNAAAMESLSLSNQLTTGNKVNLFLITLLVIAINMVGQFIPFAFLFTMPFNGLLFAVTYLRMSGQSTADVAMTTPGQVKAVS